MQKISLGMIDFIKAFETTLVVLFWCFWRSNFPQSIFERFTFLMRVLSFFTQRWCFFGAFDISRVLNSLVHIIRDLLFVAEKNITPKD